MKINDEATISYSGKVVWIGPEGSSVQLMAPDGARKTFGINREGVEVVSVRTPVETFAPGDIVRHKQDGSLWQILNDGYVRLGQYAPGQSYARQLQRRPQFTSESYERVTL